GLPDLGSGDLGRPRPIRLSARARYQFVEPGTHGHGFHQGLIRYAMPPVPLEIPPLALIRLVRSQTCSNCSRGYTLRTRSLLSEAGSLMITSPSAVKPTITNRCPEVL